MLKEDILYLRRSLTSEAPMCELALTKHVARGNSRDKEGAKIGGLASCKAPAALLRLAQVAANFTSRAIALLFFCPCEKSTSPVCPRAVLYEAINTFR